MNKTLNPTAGAIARYNARTMRNNLTFTTSQPQGFGLFAHAFAAAFVLFMVCV